jgi:hypothetical protein
MFEAGSAENSSWTMEEWALDEVNGEILESVDQRGHPVATACTQQAIVM